MKDLHDEWVRKQKLKAKKSYINLDEVDKMREILFYKQKYNECNGSFRRLCIVGSFLFFIAIILQLIFMIKNL